MSAFAILKGKKDRAMAFSMSGVALTFADDLFFYTLIRRLPTISVARGGILSTCTIEFSQEIGKAVLVTLHRSQATIRQQLRRDYPIYSVNRQIFMSYVKDTGLRILIVSENCLAATLEMSAFLVEVAAYCFECGLRHFFEVLPLLWSDVFMNGYGYRLLVLGGWCRLREYALPLAQVYDAMRVETPSNDGQIRYNSSWLRHNDEESEEYEITFMWQDPFETKYATFHGRPEEYISDAQLAAINNPIPTPPITPSTEASTDSTPSSAESDHQIRHGTPSSAESDHQLGQVLSESSDSNICDSFANALNLSAEIKAPPTQKAGESSESAECSSRGAAGKNDIEKLPVSLQSQCTNGSRDKHHGSCTQKSHNPMPEKHSGKQVGGLRKHRKSWECKRDSCLNQKRMQNADTSSGSSSETQSSDLRMAKNSSCGAKQEFQSDRKYNRRRGPLQSVENRDYLSRSSSEESSRELKNINAIVERPISSQLSLRDSSFKVESLTTSDAKHCTNENVNPVGNNFAKSSSPIAEIQSGKEENYSSTKNSSSYSSLSSS